MSERTTPASTSNAPSSVAPHGSEELRRSEERFHQLIDAVTDYAIYLLDADGNVATWNPGAQKAKGYLPEEIIGKHISQFYTPEDRAQGKPAAVLDVVREHGRFEEESWRVRKDGTRFWANVVLTALRGEHGELIGFAKVTRDLSERRADIERLRASEARLRALVEGVTDYAIYMLDADGHVSTWNRGAESMKGYSADEIVGKDFSVFFLPEEVLAGKPKQELEVAISAGRFQAEGHRLRKDGTTFWASVVLTPLQGDDGKLLGFAKVTQDLTARREAEDTQRELLRAESARAAAEALATRAEEANRIKDEFLATVSHELRTPLNAIVGWASILSTRELEPSVARAIEVIDRNAKLQVKIVEDILDVSRIITGKLKIEPQPVDLVAILEHAVDVVMPSVHAKEIDLVIQRGALRADVVGDPERLQQVIWNLLSNAVKFTPRGGRVAVEIRRRPSQVEIVVRDSGAGIDPAFLPYVFDRFKQADSTTTRRFGGLGLGLALVRHIVELQGGTVGASSEGLGLGSEFTVSIPVRAQVTPALGTPKPVVAAVEAPLPETRLDDLRILVVDDEEDSRELLALVLREAGAVVEQASSSAEAFEKLSRFRPQLLLSDIGMPGESGHMLVRRLRALPADEGGSIPAIALTAYTRLEDRDKATSAGFDAHVGKPVDPRKLLGLIAAVVRRRAGG
jgi:PAS domain S-box-containing protein